MVKTKLKPKNDYGLPWVVAPAAKAMGRVLVLPPPNTHDDIKKLVPATIPIDKYGFILSTGAFADVFLAAECAIENDQVKPCSDLTHGLKCEHLVLTTKE